MNIFGGETKESVQVMWADAKSNRNELGSQRHMDFGAKGLHPPLCDIRRTCWHPEVSTTGAGLTGSSVRHFVSSIESHFRANRRQQKREHRFQDY
jgi:hypothetical protein